MRIAEASIRELNNRLDAVTVVAEYVRLEKRSGRYWGACPFHNEKTPSFTVDPDRKLFYCFGCNKGGTVIDFVMEMDKLSYPEAVVLLAKKSGVELIYEGGGGERAERAGPSRKDDLRELYKRIAGSFHYMLMETAEGEAAKRYVRDRGVSHAMMERFRLGYAPRDRSWLYRFLSGKGYSAELLAASGLFSRNYPQSPLFSGRLMFPVTDRSGEVIAFGGRLLDGEGAKYLNSPETEIYHKGETLFALEGALPAIRASKTVYLAEGYMDVIALHQAEVTNAVAPLGTAFTESQARLLKRWADTVCLVFDADDAGQNAMVKAILVCRKNGLEARAVLPSRALAGENAGDSDGDAAPKDSADILKNSGPDLLKKCVKNAILDFDYLVERARSGYNMASPEGKARAALFLFPWAETANSEIAREACLDQIADTIGAGREDLRADFRRYVRDAAGGVRYGGNAGGAAGNGGAGRPVETNYELFLLAAVFVNHRLYAKFRSLLPIDELEDPGAKELYIALEEWWRNDAAEAETGIDPPESAGLPRELLDRIGSVSLRNYVLEQHARGAFSGNPGTLMADGVRKVREAGLVRRQKEIVIELRTQRGEGVMVPGRRSLADLLAEKLHLDEELKKLKETDT